MAVYYNDEGELKLLAGSTNYQFCPIGSILPFGGTTAPNGFFLCQGQALSRTEYKELFGVIGTSFGVGDGSTTFNLPDLRGEFLRGAGTNSHSGEGSGGNVGTHQGATKVPSIITRQNNIATANHNDPTANNAVENPDYGTILPSANGVGIDYNLQGTVYSSSLNSIKYTTRPTNTSVNYIIKAKVVGDESDDLTIVDSAQNNNMNPITSNAVYKNWKQEYGQAISVSPSGGTEMFTSVVETAMTMKDGNGVNHNLGTGGSHHFHVTWTTGGYLLFIIDVTVVAAIKGGTILTNVSN